MNEVSYMFIMEWELQWVSNDLHARRADSLRNPAISISCAHSTLNQRFFQFWWIQDGGQEAAIIASLHETVKGYINSAENRNLATEIGSEVLK